MEGPCHGDLAVSLENLAPFGSGEPNHHQRRTDQHTSNQRVVPGKQTLQQSRHRLPVAHGAVVALGIIEGIGETLIRVVLKMRPLVTAVGVKHPERSEDQRLVHLGAPRRMPVENLMLKRRVKRDRHAHQHERDDGIGRIKTVAGHPPQAVACKK